MTKSISFSTREERLKASKLFGEPILTKAASQAPQVPVPEMSESHETPQKPKHIKIDLSEQTP